MFCVTVSHGKRAEDWKTIATCGLSARMGDPSNNTWPVVAPSSPTMMRSSVDFPHPEGPTTQTKSRSASSNRTKSRTLNSFPFSKYDFVTFFTSRRGLPSSNLQAVLDRGALVQRPPEELVHREHDHDHHQDREEDHLVIPRDPERRAGK